MATQEELQAAITLLLANAGKLDDVVNGTDSATVTVGSGVIKTLANAIKTIVGLGSVKGFDTKANMDADLAWPAKQVAFVLTGAEAGYAYIKTGASGAGSWTLASTTFASDASDNYIAITALQDFIDDYALADQPGALNPYDGKALAWGLVDACLRLALGVNKTGEVTINGVQIGDVKGSSGYKLVDALNRILLEIASNGDVIINGIELGDIKAFGSAIVVTDNYGRIIASISSAGDIFIEGLIGEDSSEAAYLTMTANTPENTAHRIVPLHSQSTGRGVTSLPALSTDANGVENYNNKSLIGGVRSHNGTGNRAAGFVPLYEADFDVTEGETPVSGALNYLTFLLSGDDFTDSFVGMATGRNARKIYEPGFGLDKKSNGPWFTYLKTDLQLAKQAADALAATASCPFWIWQQGERDTAANTPAATYLKLLVEMQNDFINLASETFGQTNKPLMISYQTAAHRVYLASDADDSFVDIALAHWQASKVRDDIVISAPMYCIPTGSDHIHLTNEGSRVLGYYHALAAYRAVYQKEKVTSLQPKRVFRKSSTQVDVVYELVHSPLRIDTTVVGEKDNYGYQIRQADGTIRDIITGVALVGDDTVRLTTSSPVVAGDSVCYGWGAPGDLRRAGPLYGPGGNICDSQGLAYTCPSATGDPLPLHNFALVTKHII
jgi:hypothetical protein